MKKSFLLLVCVLMFSQFSFCDFSNYRKIIARNLFGVKHFLKKKRKLSKFIKQRHKDNKANIYLSGKTIRAEEPQSYAHAYKIIIPHVMRRYCFDDKTGMQIGHEQGEQQIINWFERCDLSDKSVIVNAFRLLLGAKGSIKIDNENMGRLFTFIEYKLYPQLYKWYQQELEKQKKG